MLQVGLTGGIGSGKSTAAQRLRELGALVVDSDLIAREVVAAGTPGLTAIIEAFGPGVLRPDGELDRPRVASIVFGDPARLAVLNGIVHPRVRDRSAELIAAAGPAAIVVQDVPLLVENGMAATFPLVIVVHADPRTRVQRLVTGRGMPAADARARIAAQASDEQRRAAADVWLDNSGTPERLRAAVDELWQRRLLPFEENQRLRRPAAGLGTGPVVDPDPDWAEAGARLAARIALAAGERGLGVEHIGATAVPGLPAEDLIELQLAVGSWADADALADRLAAAGFPELAAGNGGAAGSGRTHGGADPGRPALVRVRLRDSPARRQAVLIRDWLRADSGARQEYRSVTHGIHDGGTERIGDALQRWWASAGPRATRWAARTARPGRG